MPHWESVHGIRYEVPGFVQFLAKKRILEDASWKNDAAPAFGVYDEKTDRKVILWVDHPILSRRESGSERFQVQADDEVYLSTNELETALETLFHELGKFHAGRTPKQGPKEWRPSNPQHAKQEWEDHLRNLLEEYLDK